MRCFIAALAIAALSILSVPAEARSYKWCAEYGPGHGGINCGFTTFRQCQAAISGNGGFCRRDFRR